MGLKYFLICIVLYYLIHSLLAAKSVKQLLHPIISKRIYRIFFNLVSLLLLIPLIWMYFQIEHQSIFVKTNFTKAIGWGILVFGLLTNFMAIRQYNLSEFSGLSYLNEKDTPNQKSEQLNRSGLNKWMRHPLYSTTLLVLLGVVLLAGNEALLGIALISLVYILIGIQLEERKLIEEFGADYLAYKKEVRMLIPFLF